MNLIIDIGNTRTKIALFNGGELMLTVPLDELTTDNVQLLLDEHPTLDKAILSATKPYSSELQTFLKDKFKLFIELDKNTPLPITNHYGSKETLGNDRLAAAVGANMLFPDENVLIIDAGTAITYDIVNTQNQYLGGNISPGMEMRFKALHHFTGNLPLVIPETEFPMLANNTIEAIRTGVQQGIFFEIESYITLFNEKFKNLRIIITGGDIKFFDRLLKNSIFVRPNLVLYGLNKILEFNDE